MKIKTDEEMPERLRNIVKLSKDMGQQAMPQVWNGIIQTLSGVFGKQFTAEEQLAAVGNFLNIFVCRWILEMKSICEADENDITLDALIQEVLQGIAISFGGEIEFEEPQLPHGIKRLRG